VLKTIWGGIVWVFKAIGGGILGILKAIGNGILWILKSILSIVLLIITTILKIVLGLCLLALSLFLIAAFGIGLFRGFVNYISAFRVYFKPRDPGWDNGEEPAMRSFFFGPGYKQLKDTVKMALKANIEFGKTVTGPKLYTMVAKVGSWGFAWIPSVILFLVQGIIVTVGMLVIFSLFCIAKLIDSTYLSINRILSDCPICHGRFFVPAFQCPSCGAMHKKLVPNSYGIWRHRCQCGNYLPAMFLNGRSKKLEAFCPDCGSSLLASDVRPVVFQLIGGTGSGKSIYLSAFFHEFLNKLNLCPTLHYTITEEYKPFFADLEEWYGGAECPATAQMNSQMYPILIQGAAGARRQFSIYDIAGEMFDGVKAGSEVLQQQYQYCDGLLFLVDPFSSGELRANRLDKGEDLSDFSDMPAEKVVNNFINYLMGAEYLDANRRKDTPVAVLIAKADAEEVKAVIGQDKIADAMKGGIYLNYEQARDELCRKFLTDIEMTAIVNDLDGWFTNVHYFPVSAIGHSKDGTAYSPWGVMDAVEWLLPMADKDLGGMIFS